MIWLNASHLPVEVAHPENAWVQNGEVALSTDPDLPAGHSVVAGGTLLLGGRTVVVLRQT